MTRQIALSFEAKGECESVKLKRGYFLLEAWGAQGGTCNYEESGKGGYSRGIFHNLVNDQIITICVGKQGKYVNSGTAYGGFNGGGNGYSPISSCSGGGGGSTNIILGDKNGENLVIAGGGGGICTHGSYYFGGHAGGLTGESNQTTQTYGQGGTQSEGGNPGHYSGSSYSSCTAKKGTKGYGGNACSTACAGAGGGGGGYYGGGGGADIGSGGGGSAFLNTKLKSRKTFSGSSIFISPTNGKFEVGHKGDGYAIISATNFCTIRINNTSNYFVSLILLLTTSV